MNEDSFTNEHEFPDELISAYLDGELTPAQKVRVEEQLMDSPEHRRLFEELKALRSSLQALPMETLGDDFAQRVLRRAEQELLMGGAVASEAAAGSPSSTPSATTPSATAPSATVATPSGAARRDHQRGAWRGLIWSAAAMAAAIGLIVFSPMFTEQPDRPVTVNDKESERLDRAAEHAKANDAHEQHAGSIAQQQKSKEAKQDNIVAPGNQFAKEQSLEQKGPATSGAGDAGAFSQTMAAKELKSRQQPNEPQPPVANEDLASRRGNQKFSLGGAGGGNGAHFEAGGSPPSGAIADNRALEPLSSSPEADQAGGKAVPMAAFSRGRAASAAAGSGMLVVSLDVTPDALAGRFMDEMLKKHEIQVELAKAELDHAADFRYADKERADKDQGVDRSARDTEHRDAKDLLRKKAQEAGRGGDVELMYVVASAEQIDGLLNDLKSQSEQVLSLAYDQPLALQQNKNAQAEAEELHQRAHEHANAAPPAPARADVAEKADDDLPAPVNKPLASAIAEGQPEAAVRPAQQDGQSAFGGPDIGDEAKADDKSAVDAQSFRGIARRLQLPEDFQLTLPQVPRATTGAEAGQGQGSAVGNSSPAAVQHGNLDGAASTGAPIADSLDGLPLAPDLNVLVKPGEKQAAGEKFGDSPRRALADERPAVRVLFVLRAVRQPSPQSHQIPADAAAAEEVRE